jgi:hypothetical protein
MRSLKQELGLSVLVLTACTLRIGESATDSASETGASTGSTGGSSSGGETPTTGQVTSEGSTGAANTGSESTDSASDATSTAANTSVGTDDTGFTGGDSTGVGESSGSTGGQEIVDATVEDSCAPNDGPALEFHFLLAAPMCGAAWADLAVRVNLFQGGPLAPGSYSLAGGAGFATAQSGNKPLVMTTSGTVVIDAWDGDVVSGSYELDFVDAGFVISGDFVGPHCAGGGLCG